MSPDRIFVAGNIWRQYRYWIILSLNLLLTRLKVLSQNFRELGLENGDKKPRLTYVFGLAKSVCPQITPMIGNIRGIPEKLSIKKHFAHGLTIHRT